jgi:Flp pilus assembly protein TadD
MRHIYKRLLRFIAILALASGCRSTIPLEETELREGRLYFGDEPVSGRVRMPKVEGKTHGIIRFQDGQRHGRSILKHYEGGLAEIANYEDGLPHGELRRWDTSGRLSKRLIFERGEVRVRVELPEGVDYKFADPEENAAARDMLLHVLGGGPDGQLEALFSDELVCGPLTRERLRHNPAFVTLADGQSTSSSVLPMMGDDGVSHMVPLDSINLAGQQNIITFWSYLIAAYELDANTLVRSPTREELALAWQLVSGPITEPIFVLESDDLFLMVDFHPRHLHIQRIDDLSPTLLRDMMEASRHESRGKTDTDYVTRMVQEHGDRETAADIVLHAAIGHFENGQPEVAGSEIRNAIILNPDNARAHWYLGRLLTREAPGSLAVRAAHASFARAAELEPNNTEYLADFGMSYANLAMLTRKGDHQSELYQQAEETLLKARTQSPSSRLVHSHIVLLLMFQSEYAPAWRAVSAAEAAGVTLSDDILGELREAMPRP